MKKIICLIYFLALWLPEVEAQNCSTDSIVIILIKDRGDEIANKIQTDTFDLTTGMRHRTIIDLADSSIFQTSVQTFTRRYLVLNNNQDTLFCVLMDGNGSGFSNLKSINISYDPVTNLILNRIEYTGSGTNWILHANETWTYNGNDLISEYTKTNLSGNVQKVIHSYSGTARQSSLYQTGSGSNWINDQLFSIIYTAGARDSIILQAWDSGNTIWMDSLSSNYPSIRNYQAQLSDTTQLGGITTISDFSFDTLDLMRTDYQYYADSLNSHSQYYRYEYIHNHRVVYNDVYVTNGCVNGSSNLRYDQYGVQSSESWIARCGHGSDGGWSNIYDENYRITYRETNYSGPNSDYYHFYNYFYPTYDSIILFYLPMGFLNTQHNLCAGSNFIPPFIVGGGCGPYSYSWSPTTGLSSDTVAQPTILVNNDTIVYTITITDSIGNVSQSLFSVFPSTTINISFDTTLCQGCPVLLTTNQGSGYIYQWYKDGVAIPFAIFTNYTATESGNYTVRVTTPDCTGFAPEISLNLLGLTRVTGRVFWDKNLDCNYSGTDVGLSKSGLYLFLIEASSQSRRTTVLPDSTGYYEVPIDTGESWIKFYNPSKLWQASCTLIDSIQIHNPSFGNLISGNDFSLTGDTTCKRLEVSVSSTDFIPCKTTAINLKYYNTGLSTESNALLKLKLPVELNLVSASHPYTPLGANAYSFAVPVIAPGEFGIVSIYADVVCNSNMANHTLCIEAEIDPKDFCSLNPDSTWDGSNIRVSSSCQGSNDVCFIITNEALSPTGHMNSTSTWRLFADNSLIQQGNFNLSANSDTTLCFPSDGYTYRLEADQAPGFPSPGYAYSSIERCGTRPGGPSLNKILNHFYQNDVPNYYTFCQTTRSYTASALKTVEPEGWGTNRYLNIGDEIKYRIDFQNTSGDTAHYVEVVDDLDNGLYYNTKALDVNSLRLVSESHPCQYDFVNNILKYKFHNINLPDSGMDNLGSKGYVEFAIRIKENPTISVISNRAQVIFDSSNAINTNYVQNKICTLSNPQVSIQADTSFCIGDILVCRSTVQNYGGTSSFNWYLNGILLADHNDSLVYSGINLNDTLQCSLTSNYYCAFPPSVFSNKIIFNHAPISTPVINFQSPDLVSSSAIQYQWHFNNVPIAGAISQNYTPIASGQYQVEVWDSMGCSAISNDFPFINPLVPELRSMQFNVYPNPSYDFINIDHINKSAFSVKVFDHTGREIFVQQNGDKLSVRLQVINLTPGRYILEIVSNEELFYKPMIILGRD